MGKKKKKYVGKGEIAHNEQFLLFQQSFKKTSYLKSIAKIKVLSLNLQSERSSGECCK